MNWNQESSKTKKEWWDWRRTRKGTGPYPWARSGSRHYRFFLTITRRATTTFKTPLSKTQTHI